MNRVKFLTIFTILAGPVALSVNSADAQRIQELNHFKCYDVVESNGASKKELKIEDQFVSTVGVISKPVMLCNPVEKNGERIENKAYHLVCYQLRTQERVRPRKVKTLSQLDELTIKTGESRIMCLPVEKKHL